MNASEYLRIYKSALDRMASVPSLVLNDADLETEVRKEGLTSSQASAEAIEILGSSAGDCSAVEIEALLAISGALTKAEVNIEILNQLLTLTNHERHEDIVRGIQSRADTSSIQALVATIRAEFSYLAWDNEKALARKCFWALGKIGTEEAWLKIEECQSSNDSVVAKWANEQLQRRKS